MIVCHCYYLPIKKSFRQHRTIRQADSARDFSSSQGLESAGILYVFQTFQTAELAEKIRRSAKTQLRGVALSLRQHDMLLFQIVRFSPAADGVLKALRKLAVFRIRYADALM